MQPAVAFSTQRWKQHRNGQLALDQFSPQSTYNTNTYTRKQKRSQLLLYLSCAGDQAWCLGHSGKGLLMELSPSPVVRNYTVILLLHSYAWTLRVSQLQDHCWLKLWTNNFDLRYVNLNAQTKNMRKQCNMTPLKVNNSTTADTQDSKKKKAQTIKKHEYKNNQWIKKDMYESMNSKKWIKRWIARLKLGASHPVQKLTLNGWMILI
jgi:hypothetical protein